MYIYPLPFEALSHLPPQPIPLGWYRAPVWVSWAMQQIPCVSFFKKIFFIGLKLLYSVVLASTAPRSESAVSRHISDFLGGISSKESACQGRRCKRLRFHPWVVENGNPLQYSCLENSTDRGAWADMHAYIPSGHPALWSFEAEGWLLLSKLEKS